MELTCRRTTYKEIFDGPYWDEVWKDYGEAVPYDGLTPNVRKDVYLCLEEQGIIHVIGVYLDERLVGLASWVLLDQLQFQGSDVANVDMLWVEPFARKLGAGSLLINELWKCAREDGAKGVYLSAKIGTRAAKIFGHIAEPVNTVFLKRLEG